MSNDSKTPAGPEAPSTLARYFPIGVWLPKYKWGEYFVGDLIAALSVAALLIPESMGYSTVAGLPVQIGLYAAPLALLGYALFGGSKLLMVGAIGSVAAVVATVLPAVSSGGDSSDTGSMAATLAFMTGVVFIVAGLLKMGWIANFVSGSVLDGFVFGMSIQIIIGQLPKLTGVDKADGNTFQVLGNWISGFSDWNMSATALGVISLLTMFAIARFIPKLPPALTIIVITSIYIAVASPNLDLVKQIPAGLPSFTLPTGISADNFATLLLGGGVIALVSFSEGWGASSSLNKFTHDSLDSDQEFIAYGISNIGAGLLGGMSVGGSLSKSTAALTAKAKTQMTSIILAGIVLLTLAFFSPLFQWMAEAVLAAVVINAMWDSANPMKLAKYLQFERLVFFMAALTAFNVLAFDILPAMIFGIVLSILHLIYRISFPGFAEIGQVKGKENHYAAISWIYGRRESSENKDAERIPGISISRMSVPLLFSNAESFLQNNKNLLIKANKRGEKTKTLIVDCEMMSSTDQTGLDSIDDLKSYCNQYDIELKLASIRSEVMNQISNTETIKKVSADNIYTTLDEAVIDSMKDNSK